MNTMKRLIIIGASGHGKVVADIAKNTYQQISFLDDNDSLQFCGCYPVIGRCNDFVSYDDDFFVAIGDAAVRQRILTHLREQGKKLPVLIHSNAVVAESATVGDGSVIMAGAVINPGSTVGKGCIINTCSSVDHDCYLDDFVHVSVGSHLAGNVRVGKRSWIGIGAVVSNNINICDDCMVGAGAVVVHDLSIPGRYIGVPARKMK